MDSFAEKVKIFKRENWWIGLLIRLHLAIVLPLAYVLNVWLDEAWTMQTTSQNLFSAWTNALADERQAPLYFLIITLWRKLFDSLFFVRLFSIICSVATISLIPSLTRRFFNLATEDTENTENKREIDNFDEEQQNKIEYREIFSKHSVPPVSSVAKNLLPIILTAVVALNPYLIWASLEARGYALVILLSVLLLLNWFDGYADENIESPKRLRAQIFYVFLALISLYTNYYLGFLLFANACALIPLKRWKPLLMNVLQMICVGILFLPLVWIIKEQMAVNGDYFRPESSILAAAKVFWGYFQNFLLPADENSEVLLKIRLWTFRLSIIVLLILFFRNLFRFRWQKIVTVGVIFFVAFAFYFAAYLAVGATYVEYRNFAPLFIPFLLLFAAFLFEVAKVKGSIVWLILLLSFSSFALFSKYQLLAKNGDWNRVAKFIEQNETANQPITAFYVYDSIPLRFSYHGANEIFPKKVGFDWGAEDELGSPKRNVKQIEFLISQLPPNPQEFWLVTDVMCDDEKRFLECAPLENFVETNYTVERVERFYLRKVRLLKRKN